MSTLYEQLLLGGHIERWKTEGYNFEIMDHHRVNRNEKDRNKYHDDNYLRQNENRMEGNCYNPSTNQYNMYEPRNQRQKWNQQQRQQYSERSNNYNGFNNRNGNESFRKNGQNRDIDSQDYGRENCYNYDQNFDEYNVEYGNSQRRLRNRYKRYKDVQDGYSRDDHRDHRYDNCEESYISFNEIFSNIYNSIRLQNSLTNQTLLEDEKQLKYGVSSFANDPQLVTEKEESSNKKAIQNGEKPLEEEQTAVYMNPIIDTLDDKEDISLSEEFSNKKMVDSTRRFNLSLAKNQTHFCDSKVFAEEEGNKKESLQKPNSERSNNISESEEMSELKNYSCHDDEISQQENNISKSKISQELNETKPYQEISERTMEEEEPQGFNLKGNSKRKSNTPHLEEIEKLHDKTWRKFVTKVNWESLGIG
ncbi:uncharacterized protein DDB_G0280315-like [Leptopilina heterotoma]|uniref:uncharacterized protein DDB_G0280315-like n=1 Tax=Leptopilina heterotoma TaxID=63436 RepID=UPI001CA8906F|nr:uncharacterized protein DDB_G0280315-like [Leptopilina heterotoma]